MNFIIASSLSLFSSSSSSSSSSTSISASSTMNSFITLFSSSSLSSSSLLFYVNIIIVIIITLVIILLLSVFFNFMNKRSYTRPELYPLENTISTLMNQHRILDFLNENHKVQLEQRGLKTVDLNLFGLPRLIFTNDLENVEYILKTNFKNFGKGPIMYQRFKGLFGNGIFNSDNEIWYHHRKTSANIFNMNKFRTTILATFNEKCDILIEKLMNHTKISTDFQDLMFRFTLDSIGIIAFDHSIGALKQERVQFATDFDYCQESTNQSFIDPFWYFNRYFGSGLKYFSALNRINAFAYKIINERRESMKSNNGEDPKDLLSIYLKNNPNITNQELRDVIINFIIAGRDTTAQALSWSMYELCCNKDVQDNARKEMSEMNSLNESNLYNDIQNMKYLETICLETLRLHPSVPKECKHVFKNDVLPDKTKVYAGDLICFSPWVMGRNEKLWENPLEFNPDRFKNELKPNPYKFTAFQAGPRQCLGQSLALLEMKVCLFRLLSCFEFELAQSKESVTYINTITLPIKNGLQITVKII